MFNVGDIVRYRGTEYTVTEVYTNGVVVSSRGISVGRHSNGLFTLVTSTAPPKPVLTGMTKFIKEMEVKYATLK